MSTAAAEPRVVTRLEGLKQPPNNCTMMGAFSGALTYHGLGVDDATLYGVTGHAFVVNIHEQICPSGPYCWNTGPVCRGLARLGLRTEYLGYFGADSTPELRGEAERKLIAHLDAGGACSLLNLEHQLITGRDEVGFFTAQPWACADFPPKKLSYGTWAELGGKVHMSFWLYHRDDAARQGRADSVRAALEYLVDFNRHPGKYTGDAYAAGLAAWPQWIEAVRGGHGARHGHWWNAQVWSECRAKAAEFFMVVKDELPVPEAAAELSALYKQTAESVARAGDKSMPAAEQIAFLQAAAENESKCVAVVERLLASW
jgi:hypothetical protein